MEKTFTCIDQDGNEVKASFEEAKEKGFTIAVDSLKELEEYLNDETAFTLTPTNPEAIEEGASLPDGEFFIYGDGAAAHIPDDPREGDEGYDDKLSYTEIE